MTFLHKRKCKYYGVILLIIAAITFSALAFLKHYDDTNQQYVRNLTELNNIEQSALNVQYFFKRQVQEWKNILLRGHLVVDYEKYNELFADEFLKTQEAAEHLYNLIAESSQAKPLAKEFMVKHREILTDYQDALQVFKKSNFDAKQADLLIRGVDRQPTEMIDTVSRIIQIEVSQARKVLNEHLNWIRWSTSICFMALQILLCFVVLRLTNKLLKANISDKYIGIGNREMFIQTINDAIRAKRKMSATIIDIDNFKLINEAFGSKGGDKYLKAIAQKLQERLGPKDVLCRISSDVFGLVSYHRNDIETESFTKELLTVIERYEHQRDAMSISLSACAGIFCMHKAHETSVEHLLNKLYASLQEAKELGPGNFVNYYDENKHIAFRQQQMRKATDIFTALKDARLVLFKQEIRPFDESNHHIYHEVLLRVVNEDGLVQGPGLFLQSAERFHLMDKIDRYVLSAVVEYLAKHPEDDGYYTVNLSGDTLCDLSFVQFVDKLFASNDVRHNHIGFEITETNIIKNFKIAQAVLEKLASYQCKISLDDFGTGMSSYSYISKLAINCLKIDGTFIKEVNYQPHNQAIIRSVVQLAKDLGISTVAEFIETKEELEIIEQLRVDYVQGYFLHVPDFMYQPSEACEVWALNDTIKQI